MGWRCLSFNRGSRPPQPKPGRIQLYANGVGIHFLDEDGSELSVGGVHDHDQYAPTGHDHGASEHPDLAAHETLGLAAEHEHDFAPSGHGHVHDHDGDYAAPHAHPYSADTHDHDPDYSPIHAHPYSADDHAHAEYATDDDLTTHAATTHGTTAHAISGVSHTGSLDHSALGSVTANQHHNQAHALGGADHSGALAQASVTNLVSDLAGKADSGHNHDADYAADGHTHPGGSEAFPVGSVFLSVVTTDPATLLGYGTWAAFGAGRMLVGFDAGQAGFDTDEETGGAATHAHSFTQPGAHADHGALTHSGATVGNHAFTQPNAHTDVPTHTHATDSQGAHVHDEYRNSATTGGLDGWAAGDTSTNTPLITGYDTGSAGAHTHTASAPAGAVASQPHAGGAVDAHAVGQASQHAAQSHSAHSGGAVVDGSTLPPYITVHMWKRTA